jgi:hypothetical protein
MPTLRLPIPHIAQIVGTSNGLDDCRNVVERKRVKRLMRAAARTEPVGRGLEIHLICVNGPIEQSLKVNSCPASISRLQGCPHFL